MAETSKSGELIVAPDAGVTYNLDAFPEAEFNRLIPMQTIRMPSDLMVPVVQVVKLDAADRDGKSPDHYKSNDVPAGHRAPTARGLNKLATAASVSFYDERRLDDGSDPDVMGVGVMASMLLPTGQRITAPGSQLINIRTWFGATTSAAELAKFRKQFYGHVSTRAKNRAIRGLLSLRSSYPDAEIQKPFAVVSYAPNMNHPEVRARILEAMAPSVAQLYGPSTPATAQLGAGAATVEVEEAPEGDAQTAAAGAAPRAGEPEPDWFGTTPAENRAENRLAAVLREKAASSGMVGPRTAPQKTQLQAIFTPLGLSAAETGLRIVFGLAALSEITAAQAQAVIETAVDATFADLWREMVAEGQAAAA